MKQKGQKRNRPNRSSFPEYFPCRSESGLNKPDLKEYLFILLKDLENVPQSPRYHPEGDALFHSLQVFQIAYATCRDPQMWTAALLHDIGKAMDHPKHDIAGAEALMGILSPRIVWLVRNHLKLLTQPVKTRRRLGGSPQGLELEMLRRWDLQGRKVDAQVMTIEESLELVLQHHKTITNPVPASQYIFD